MSDTNGSNGHDQAAVVTAARRLTVSDILAADDIVEEDVFVPEWDGSVRIRAFTKARQHEVRAMAIDPRTGQHDEGKLELQAFIHGVIDPKFEPVQVTELREKSAGAVDRVLKRILAISGMSEGAANSATKSVSR